MKIGILASAVLLSLALCAPHAAPARAQAAQDDELKGLVITMKQENHCGCIGCCAVYSVTITGDGTVTYEGVEAVKVVGKQVYSIQAEQVRELLEEFRKADFFSLKDRYTQKENGDGTVSFIDHAAPVTISITLKGRKKSVYNFFGAPEKLGELEKKIYDASRVDVFVNRP